MGADPGGEDDDADEQFASTDTDRPVGTARDRAGERPDELTERPDGKRPTDRTDDETDDDEARTDEDETDDESGGNVAGPLKSAGTIEAGDIDLENAVFVVVGVVLAVLMIMGFVNIV